MRGAVAAEWVKFWSVGSTWVGLAAISLLMLVFPPAVAEASKLNGLPPASGPDLATGAAFYLGQFLVLAVSALFVTAEYASGSIRTSLQCVPVRGRLLLAKAAVLLPVLFGLGTVLALLAVATAAPVRGGAGASAGDVVFGALGTGGYFALLGVLSLGVGTALRSTAGTIVVVFLLLLMIPMLVASLVGPAVLDYFPGNAGVDAMTGPGRPDPVFHAVAPYGRWVGLLVCAGWAGIGMLAGNLVLRHRDA